MLAPSKLRSRSFKNLLPSKVFIVRIGLRQLARHILEKRSSRRNFIETQSLIVLVHFGIIICPFWHYNCLIVQAKIFDQSRIAIEPSQLQEMLNASFDEP